MNPDHSLRDAKVGDTLILYQLSFRNQPSFRNQEAGSIVEMTVTKRARTYLTAEWQSTFGHTHAHDYHMDTGIERHGSNDVTYYLGHAYTEEGWGLRRRRQAVKERLQPLLRSYGWFDGLSTGQLERIADIIEEGK